MIRPSTLSPCSRAAYVIFVVLCALGLALSACEEKSEDEAGDDAPPCTGEKAEECISEGVALQEGKGGEKNPAKALELYMMACDAGADGDPRGCTLAGHLYKDGKEGDSPDTSVEQDYDKARELYVKACEADEGMGCFHAGNAYGVGELETKKDPKKAYEYLQKACELDFDPEFQKMACDFASKVKSAAEAPTPEEREKKCRDGDDKACSELGMAYIDGSQGINKDPKKGVELMEVACDRGHGMACAGIALAHKKGMVGDKPDLPTSHEYLQKACDGGYLMGCRALGQVLMDGKETDKDTERAAKLFDKACNAEKEPEYKACMYLAILYRQGDGVEQNDDKAETLIKRACEKGKLEPACKAME